MVFLLEHTIVISFLLLQTTAAPRAPHNTRNSPFIIFATEWNYCCRTANKELHRNPASKPLTNLIQLTLTFARRLSASPFIIAEQNDQSSVGAYELIK